MRTMPFISQESVELHYSIDWSSNIGHGLSGIVRLCTLAEDTTSTKKFAVKILKDTPEGRKEVECHHRCSGHPNVVTLHGVFANNFKLPGDFSARSWLFCIMEYVAGGELFYRLKASKRFSESQAQQVIVQVADALSHIHSNGVAHRDLKPENIFVCGSETLTVKVGDFGFATAKAPRRALYTAAYVAPEVIESQHSRKKTGFWKEYTEACDVWSLGVIMYVLVVGYTPFWSKKAAYASDLPQDMRQQILSGQFDFPARDFDSLSKPCKDLISEMLTVSPNDRITAAGVLDHDWLKLETRSEHCQAKLVSGLVGGTCAVEADEKVDSDAEKLDSPNPKTDSADSFRVHIRAVQYDSKTLSIPCSGPVTLIRALMQHIENAMCLSRDLQRLIFSGKLLDPSRTLSDYQVADGDTIYLAIKPQQRSLTEISNVQK